MTMKPWLVATLVRLFPARWRAEYGSELEQLLLTRPLTAHTILDVSCSGLRQRIRSADLVTWFGLGAMLVVIAAMSNGYTVLEPSHMTFPAVSVRPLHSDLYVVFLIASGCALQLHARTRLWRTGVAAMKISVIASVPIIVAGVLLVTGIAQPGPNAYSPAGWQVAVAPISALGGSWIWGAVGGALGRAIARVAARGVRC
jgi:hypothetical protein